MRVIILEQVELRWKMIGQDVNLCSKRNIERLRRSLACAIVAHVRRPDSIMAVLFSSSRHKENSCNWEDYRGRFIMSSLKINSHWNCHTGMRVPSNSISKNGALVLPEKIDFKVISCNLSSLIRSVILRKKLKIAWTNQLLY